MRLLIGSTGVVGGTLLRQTTFDEAVHRPTIDRIAGHRYDLVVCAGAPAVKWKANQEPEADAANLGRLQRHLDTITADHFILVSTIDVYPNPQDVDETTAIDPAAGSAYGRHRFALEEYVRARFPRHNIVRLPALFGQGLKKNVIYDALNDHMVDAISPDAVFQWYPLSRLWHDLEAIRAAGLPTVNVATEPLPVRDLLAVLDVDPRRCKGTAVAHYDMQTRYADLLGGRGRYLVSRDQILEALEAFVVEERSR